MLADDVASTEIETVTGQAVTPVIEGDVWTAFWPEETPLGDDPPVARATAPTATSSKNDPSMP